MNINASVNHNYPAAAAAAAATTEAAEQPIASAAALADPITGAAMSHTTAGNGNGAATVASNGNQNGNLAIGIAASPGNQQQQQQQANNMQPTSEEDNMDFYSDDDDEDDSKSNYSSSNQDPHNQNSHKRRLKGDIQRSHHNVLERKRRDLIKESFAKLRDSVPTLISERASRAQILKKAADFIQVTHQKNESTRNNIKELMRKNMELESVMLNGATAAAPTKDLSSSQQQAAEVKREPTD